jgi:hypothetical protein
MKYLIIAGSEKSGTTSLYQYLADSNLFSNSMVKETDYFRNKNLDLESQLAEQEYLNKYFKAAANKGWCLEASPGYLSDSQITAPNIAKTLKNYELVFCLRNPFDRLKSSFLFHKSRLYLPKDMDFNDYVALCMQYEKSELADYPIEEWFLRVPECGKYYMHLQDFCQSGGEGRLHIFTFDELSRNPKSVVKSILATVGINTDFYDDYNFGQSNVTFGYKNESLQRLALGVNKTLERVWVKFPVLKSHLLKLYQRVNGRSKERIQVTDKTKSILYDFYAKDIESLASKGMLPVSVAENWISSMQ